MTLVNTETGELVEFDRAAAERRALKISLRLDSIAENFEAVMPMIREAIAQRDDVALGYRSPGDYVSDRFGNALSRLPLDLRREVVSELTEAGLSTRAIAPIAGVDHSTVVRDLARGADAPPQAPEGGASQGEPGAQHAAPRQEESTDPRPRVTTGRDGKAYPRPEPKPQRATRRAPLTDFARDAVYDLEKVAEKLARVLGDDRFKDNRVVIAERTTGQLNRSLELIDEFKTALRKETTP